MWRDNQVFQASSMRSAVSDVVSVRPRPHPAGFLRSVARPGGDLRHLNRRELRQAAWRTVAPSDCGRTKQSSDGCRCVALSSEAERALVSALRQTVQAVLSPAPKKRRWRTRRRGRKRPQADRSVTPPVLGWWGWGTAYRVGRYGHRLIFAGNRRCASNHHEIFTAS